MLSLLSASCGAAEASNKVEYAFLRSGHCASMTRSSLTYADADAVNESIILLVWRNLSVPSYGKADDNPSHHKVPVLELESHPGLLDLCRVDLQGDCVGGRG